MKVSTYIALKICPCYSLKKLGAGSPLPPEHHNYIIFTTHLISKISPGQSYKTIHAPAIYPKVYECAIPSHIIKNYKDQKNQSSPHNFGPFGWHYANHDCHSQHCRLKISSQVLTPSKNRPEIVSSKTL